MFEKIKGNEPIKSYLRKALEKESLPHALLFRGIDGIGKSLFAQEMAAFLLKTEPLRIEKELHPDFHPIRPEGKSALFSIETLRKMIDEVHEAPFEADRKVFLLYDAERMQPAAANALLKILEEPNPDTTFFLITSQPKKILPTIASRLAKLHFQPLSDEEIAALLKERGISETCLKSAHGSFGRALERSSYLPIEEILFELLSKELPYYESSQKIEEIEKRLDEARLAVSRNIKFSSCLEQLVDQIRG